MNVLIKTKLTYQYLNQVAKKEIYDKEVTNYKRTLKDLERKIIDKSINEEKLKKENESFKRQIQFYKDKLKIELTNKRNKTPLKASIKKLRFQETELEFNEENEKNLERKSIEYTPEKTKDVKKPNDRSKNLTSTELYVNPIKEQKNISTKKVICSNLKKVIYYYTRIRWINQLLHQQNHHLIEK